jgi:hypothetical protein
MSQLHSFVAAPDDYCFAVEATQFEIEIELQSVNIIRVTANPKTLNTLTLSVMCISF